MSDDRPLVALTMGDVAGVGPEVIARAWAGEPLRALARPFVVGDPDTLRRAVALLGAGATVRPDRRPRGGRAVEPASIPCLAATDQDLSGVRPGLVDARAGRAAADFLIAAIDLALAGRVDAIATLPLQKESLHAAGVRHPGHTEILAERCRAPEHAMMLYLDAPEGSARSGLGVIHATLHVALRRVFDLLTVDAGRGQDPPGRRGPPPPDRRAAPPGGRGRPEPARRRERPVRRRGSDDHRPGRRPGRRLGGRRRSARSPPTPSSPAPSAASSTPWSPCTTTRGTSRSRRSASTAPSTSPSACRSSGPASPTARPSTSPGRAGPRPPA